MKHLHFDCFAGISGDMVLGALIDAGLDFNLLKDELLGLCLGGYKLSCCKTVKSGITGTSFKVELHEEQPERHYSEITGIINRSSLKPKAKEDALGIFRLLAEAESSVHGIKPDELHFHEIGAVDSIIDICGAAIAINAMGFGKITCSAINTGSGLVKTAHGMLPVPAPATARLLSGMTAYSSGIMAELTTPTGAAILRYFAGSSSHLGPLTIDTAGYGAGSMDLDFPNMLRVFTGKETLPGPRSEEISEIETSIDDMNPEFYSAIVDSLLQAGALDVSVIPQLMKKNRPGQILKVLARPEDEEKIMKDIFISTTTSGIRHRRVMRKVAERSFREVSTEYGKIKVKVHYYDGELTTASPEYEDCRRLALENKIPVKKVYNAALSAFYKSF